MLILIFFFFEKNVLQQPWRWWTFSLLPKWPIVGEVFEVLQPSSLKLLDANSCCPPFILHLRSKNNRKECSRLKDQGRNFFFKIANFNKECRTFIKLKFKVTIRFKLMHFDNILAMNLKLNSAATSKISCHKSVRIESRQEKE